MYKIIMVYFKLSFIMTHVGNLTSLDTKLENCFKLSFIIVKVDNLDAILKDYFELCFILAK